MTSTNDGTEIAIIGKACRFPGANDQRQYWQNLREGKESVTFFDSEALRAAGVADELIDDPAYVKAFGALDDIDLFDAGFFGFSARDATVLDPQQRVLLETAWQALEDAGQRRFGDDVTVGVFAGSSMSTYLLANLLPGRAMDTSPDGFELLIANDKDYLASRIAYKLDLDGPAVSVQTACSTSMVAVHLACQSLLSYDCDVALAGGATIRLPQHGYRYQEGMILSADGHCRPFDAKASGTIGGNGAGIVVLKRLDDALADGDRIDAVIKGSAVNNDGARKVGYTAPGSTGQAKVVAAALGAAGIDPGTIGAIEAHGTGTALGDPIEIAALTKVFGPYHAGGCPIGSVKSNIGHLDSAAGIAALIKAILQLQHREIAPSLNFEQENPDIGFDATPFFVNTELRPWQATGTPRRIGVSSFGFGGTNAHCVLEEAPAATRSTPGKPVQAIVLSARSAGALDAMTGRIGRELRESGEPLADTAFSLQTTRTALPHRRVVLCSSAEDAAEAIENRDPQRVLSRQAGDAPEVAWLFPGQGTQYPAMGRDLYRDEPVFRAGVDECAELLRPHLGLDLRDVLYAEDGGDRIERTELAQPALFTVEYALAKTLESWCGKPKAMLGHSVGEVVAACLAGVFTLPDALHMVAVRGKLMQQQPSGAMLTVALSEDDLREVLVPSVEIAAINAPGQCAVAGTHDAIDEFAELLRERGIDFGRLHTSHAFHTAMMDPAVAPLTEALSRIPLSAPAIPFLSNRSGDWITAAQATDPAYWAGQVRDPVRFHACLRKLAADPGTVLLEAGPGHTLGSLSRMDPDLRGHVLVNAMRAPAEEHSDTRFLLDAVGRLWLTGVEVDWAAMHEGEHRRLLSLPPYAFDRKRYWIGAPAGGETPTRSLDSAIVSTVEEETEDEQSGGSRPDLLTAYAAPETEAQQRIARIWQDLIGVGPIGIHDNFIELGGHSLLATKIVAGVRAEFAVDVPLRDLIAAPTVEAMAALVVEAGGAPSERERLPVAVPDPAARYEPFPLSEIQQAQWIGRSANFSVGNVAAHIYWEVEDDRIDLGRLGGSFNRILARHDMLRAIITSDGTQRILADAGPYEIDVLDLRTTPADRAAEELALVRERMSHEVRPGDEWPLFNIRAALLPGGLTRVFLGFDLMVSDMGSVRVMLRDWRTLYEDPSAELTPLRITFRDYLMAIGKLKESALYQRSLAYWRDRVRDLPPAPELPLATAPDTITEPRFVPCSRTLPVAQWESIKERAGKYGVTPSAVLLAAYALVLGTWSTSEKFTLNVTTNNRLPVHEDVGGLVGGFASFNLVPVDLAEHGTLGAIARAIQAQSWEDLDHRYVNGVDVLRELARARGGTSGSVMPIVYTSTLVDESETERSMVDWIGGLTYEVIQTPQVWLDAGVLEVSDGLYLSWPAVEGLFAAGVVEEMFAAYCGVLELLAGGDSGWESGVDSVLPGWQREVIESVNDTAAPIDVQLLHGPLVECALADPSARAVFADGEWTTFGELYVRACRTARTLRSLGVGPGQVVAVSMDKTAAQITAVVAVLLAGGVYVPIDPELPTARRHHMATHAGARLILTTEARETLDWPDNTRVALLDTAPVDLAEATRDATPEQVSQLDDLAYIIYTSGSTGLPKGVAITHRAASNTCLDINARFGVTSADRALALSSLSFDLSVWDVFGVLGAGGSLVLPATGRDPAHWHELITTHDITVWNSVPALMTMYTEHLPTGTPATSLRLVMLSGDWIPLALPDNLWATHPDIDLYSLGGATEAAIWSVYHPITALDPEWTSIPYGTPLANQQLHVLDTQLQPCPIHTTGDLYISGDGLATGYHNDPGKTHAAFLTHPTTGTRLYKTGDLARRHPDGTLEFLGRTDTQVKINGHRIELGEIETTLTTHPDIHTAIATTTGPPHHKQLHAYLYPHPHTTLTPEQLRTQTHHHLTQTLPTYMHPTTTTILTHLPLTPNGKINRNHLPHPTTTTPETTTADAPLSELAVRLAAIAAEVLGVEHIDARASFFEVGGDSITAVQIAARAGDQGVQLVLADLFEAETIADAAAIIEARATSLDGAGDAVELTPSQRALLDGAKPGGTANWVELPVDADFFVCPEWIEALLRRHPALRGRFERDGEDWVQRIGEAGTYVPEIDLRVLREDRQRGAMRQMVDEMREELDPREGGLVKFAVFDLHDTRYLVCLAHELVADGRSWGALLGELAGLTGATEAAPARVTLGAEETATILTAAEETYRMSAEEVVLAACLDLLGGTGSTVHFEHDRREQPTAVGALGGIAEIGPVEPGTELPEVKRRYRSAVEAPAVHSPDVLVRSLGSVPCPVPAWPHWEPAGRAAAELTWAIADGGLVVAWTGDAPATSTDFADAVRRVGQRCRGHEEIHVDTGDFPLADVDDEDLAAVFAEVSGEFH
ncbi:non-ribosomal peptide synthetase/type I polyketide synthase [Amycolatopsis sp. CA-230715]|uniref:non-ribosomal peptide synthetase/type I polyketide synthase n=1 Tax=Amycolatopsis sp. CA-230715 TaxID=2745196 RepID=UPI001C0230D2|nr:non-ribosomal peptide synthetase/type I polyketide synthase [Amycolatopsis sp. CA-230715]QWF82464.1 D-alanine--poly(phosphoribitol) ligase subunit 1 [Amycolatopsis sp. CA-230715]